MSYHDSIDAIVDRKIANACGDMAILTMEDVHEDFNIDETEHLRDQIIDLVDDRIRDNAEEFPSMEDVMEHVMSDWDVEGLSRTAERSLEVFVDGRVRHLVDRVARLEDENKSLALKLDNLISLMCGFAVVAKASAARIEALTSQPNPQETQLPPPVFPYAFDIAAAPPSVTAD